MGALSINFNTMGIYVTPGPKAEAKANVTLDPPNSTYQLINRLKTVKGEAMAAQAVVLLKEAD